MKPRHFLSPLVPTALVSAALLGCSTDTTAPVARVPKASFITSLSELPVPELHSAELVGSNQGFAIVRLSFLDTADNEALVSAQFIAADGSGTTQNIGGTPGTGERVVDVYAPKGVAMARINYMFNDPGGPATCGCLFGMYSATVPVTSGNGSTTTNTNKGKGHK